MVYHLVSSVLECEGTQRRSSSRELNFRLNSFFSLSATDQWNGLPQAVIDAKIDPQIKGSSLGDTNKAQCNGLT